MSIALNEFRNLQHKELAYWTCLVKNVITIKNNTLEQHNLDNLPPIMS